jgi:hypothetical protein
MTLALGIISSLIILFIKPINGLLVFYASMIWYPTALTFQVATLDFSVARISCLILFFKVVLDNRLTREFKITLLDKFMIFYFVGQFIAGSFTTDLTILVINRFGFFFDVFIPFFIVRIIIKDSVSFEKFIKGIMIITAPLALIALLESVTHHNYLLFGRSEPFIFPRWGMKRAMVTFSHPIYFGVFMSMIFGLGMFLWPKPAKFYYRILLLMILAGVGVSFSSGGWLGAASMIGISLLFKYRRNWRQILWTGFVLCVLIELFSNRHFYNVIDRIALNPHTAWYRTRLIEVAIFEGGMNDHWLFGYGYGVDPMWCINVDGRQKTDMVNHYLLILSQFGLLGFVPFMGLIWQSLKNIYNKLPSLKDNTKAWRNWIAGSTLLGIFLSINSVSLFGSPVNMLFIMFALTPCLKITKFQQIQSRNLKRAI